MTKKTPWSCLSIPDLVKHFTTQVRARLNHFQKWMAIDIVSNQIQEAHQELIPFWFAATDARCIM